MTRRTWLHPRFRAPAEVAENPSGPLGPRAAPVLPGWPQKPGDYGDRLGYLLPGRGRGQMAITSQMIHARVMMSRAGPEAQGAPAAFERAELAEQEAGG